MLFMAIGILFFSSLRNSLLMHVYYYNIIFH